MSEALAVLLRVNLAAAVAVTVVLALRLPVRRLFGARVAYGLWMLVPLAAAAMLAPARVVTITQTPMVARIIALPPAAAAASPDAHRVDISPWLLALWGAGVLASLLWLTGRQVQFGRAVQAGRGGPAVIGVLKPRIVLPADFEARYSPRERQVILAHERTHIVRQDPRINALVAMARCAAWFNPLAHLGAHVMRIDQELACDAEVVAAHPAAKRSYAEAMLKTQLAARPLPLGCYWPSQGAHPLAERIGLLSHALPGRSRQTAGAAAVAVLALGGAVSAWAARPPQIVARTAVPAPPPARPVRPAQALAIAAVQASQAKAATAAPRETPPRDSDPQAEAWTPTAASELIPASTGPAPAYKVYGVAERSHVEPGAAVRVLATMTDPEGHRLVTDLTAFGSQTFYRTGVIQRDGSRYALFTSVEQRGQTLLVTASLGRGFRPGSSGTIPLASGETGTIVFDNGQAVTVTPMLRAETPEEAEEGRRSTERLAGNRFVLPVSFTPDPFRCGHIGALC